MLLNGPVLRNKLAAVGCNPRRSGGCRTADKGYFRQNYPTDTRHRSYHKITLTGVIL